MPDILTLIVFLVAGAVVSLDVAGLTLTKIPQFTNQKRSIKGWAFSNACWHAGLLLIYIFFIDVIIAFSFEVGNWVHLFFHTIHTLLIKYFSLDLNLAAYADKLIEYFKEHMPLIVGAITLFIVWDTYSEKIISKPESGNSEQLPPLAKTVYDLIEIIARLPFLRKFEASAVSDYLNWQAQAALVAVDMLALAALMQSMKYLDNATNQYWLVFIVFGTVLLFTYVIAIRSQAQFSAFQDDHKYSYHSINMKWTLVTMRMLEPLLIFYFVLELLGYLIFGQKIHSVGFFFGAALLLFSLVKKHSLAKIINAATAEPDKTENSGTNNLREIRTILIDFWVLLKRLLIWMGDIFIVLSILLALSMFLYDKPEEIKSLDAHISQILGLISLLLTIAFFYPYGCLKVLKNKAISVFNTIRKNRYTYLSMLAALIIAAIIPIFDQMFEHATPLSFTDNRNTCPDNPREIYNQINGIKIARDLPKPCLESLGFEEKHIAILHEENSFTILCPKTLGLTWNHIHALQISIWLIYLFAIGWLIKLVEDRWEKELKQGKRTNPDEVLNKVFINLHLKSILVASIWLFPEISKLQIIIREWYEQSMC